MRSGARKNTVMNKPLINIVLDDSRWEQELPLVNDLSDTVFNTTLEFVSRSEPSKLTSAKLPIAVNLSLSNNETVHLLNKQFRGMDKPTNVLSFANIDDPDFDFAPAGVEYLEIGDIIIALETLQLEAAEKQISLADHFCHLLAHGLLHLLGYDHQEDAEAEHMEDFEVKILHKLNIKNPYEE